MGRDYLEQPLNQLRRKDRAKDDDWIKAFLKRGAFGVMATSYEGQPFTNTRQYVYDPSANAIYMHGAKTGRTPAVIEANDRVCFSVSRMGRLIPADEAVEVSVEFAGVMVFGRVSMVENQAEAARALQLAELGSALAEEGDDASSAARAQYQHAWAAALCGQLDTALELPGEPPRDVRDPAILSLQGELLQRSLASRSR